MGRQELIFTNHVAETIDRLVAAMEPSKVFVLVDVNTASFVLPRLQAMSKTVADAEVITVKAGDVNKDLEALASIWRQLGDRGGTRHALIINVGGGVVTDMGAFAAATFKRGIRCLNIPTTLLGAVDASVGGKTGINFNGFKNEIGAFSEAEAVIISTTFFNTLPQQELLSGYAEMLKHGLIADKRIYNDLLAYRIDRADNEHLLRLLEESVNVKNDIVGQDPEEHGIRRALNLGHTIGHAFESLAMERKSPIPHGYAVAWGLVVELILSHMQLRFPSDELQRFAAYVHDNYGAFEIDCSDYDELLRFMSRDKKNVRAGEINFTLLKDVGDVKIDCTADREQIKAALDIYLDLMHL